MHREIGIDMGHRVPDHGSKCRNLHGHRYKIVATCEGKILDQDGNEENGMVIDFGNVKKYMMDWLDSVFDHGFVVYKNDITLMNMFFPKNSKNAWQGNTNINNNETIFKKFNEVWNKENKIYLELMKSKKYSNKITLPNSLISNENPSGLKIIIVNYVPTAENLAKHMYTLLSLPIKQHYGNDIKLVNLRLFETPNGYVDFPGMKYNN